MVLKGNFNRAKREKEKLQSIPKTASPPGKKEKQIEQAEQKKVDPEEPVVEAEKKENDKDKDDFQPYFSTNLGKNMIKCLGKADEIKESFNNLIADMDEKISLQISKTMTNVC